VANLLIQAVRGMNDILPDTIGHWHFIETYIHYLMQAYGYNEIRLPIVESTALYKRSLGDVTDIVEKEMYTFADRNGDNLTLRPEGTAGCVRAALQNSLLHQLPQRLWYAGPMFRHERPQKGRYRQFYQFGVEVFGLNTPAIDAEVIAMSAQLWKLLGVEDQLTLHINSLGTPLVRQHYRETLVKYLTPFHDQLDADSQRRLQHNPMRILDSKNPQTQEIVANAPRLLDHLDTESQQHFASVCKMLETLGIAYTINPGLVRGLDYYTHTVFEWVTDRLGAQDTVCAGGRYDGLVEQLGGKATPAVGFALGLERLLALVSAVYPAPTQTAQVYVIAEEKFLAEALLLAQQLREDLPELCVITDNSGASIKSQFKKADKSGAEYAAIIGEHEVAAQQVSLKPLRTGGEQQSLSYVQLVEFLGRIE
jgi:histidyl-tRNA synthetase